MDDFESSFKKRKIDAPEEEAQVAPNPDSIQAIDENLAHKIVLQLQKCIVRNQQDRSKYPDEPTNEIELHATVKDAHALAGAPHLYEQLIAWNFFKDLLGLISHDNLALLAEIVDVDTEKETASVLAVAEHLLANNMVSLMAMMLSRLKEASDEERQAVNDIMGVMESTMEVVLPSVLLIGCNDSIMKWLLQRIIAKGFDDNKSYAVEIISIIVSQSQECRLFLGNSNGIEHVLRSIAQYKKVDPSSDDEEEMLENLLDILCFCLVERELKQQFSTAEGTELMLMILDRRVEAYHGCLKVLDAFMADDAQACETFVNAGGLKSVFPVYMWRGFNKKHDKRKTEDTERVITILHTLATHLGVSRSRLFSKFLESNFEKTDRLIELHGEYSARVADAIAKRGKEYAAMEPEDAYLERLDDGLFTLQLVDLMIARLCSFDAKVKSHIHELFNTYQVPMESVTSVLDDGLDEKTAEIEISKLIQLRANLL